MERKKKSYTSYEQAKRDGGRDVWPCGIVGRCMPCGRIHDFGGADALGQFRHDFRCWQNHERGCPAPKPEPRHEYIGQSAQCCICGAKRGWLDGDGAWFPTIAVARKAKVQRNNLRRGNGRPRQ